MTPDDPLCDRRVNEVKRLKTKLRAILGLADLESWFATPNSAFENQTPNQVIRSGHINRLWAMVYWLESGEPS